MNQYLKKFVESIFDNPGKALDLGAGNFINVLYLEQMGWKCEGVDIKNGVDLEFPYISKAGPFDLVFSNYVIHKIKNQNQFIQTAFDNLKKNGWLFIQTFDNSDLNSSSNITAEYMQKLLTKREFKNISAKIIECYDNEEGHKHWHKILEISAQK